VDAASPVSAGWRFGQTLPRSRIGIVGDVSQYPYVGPRLTNTVRAVGVLRHKVLETPRSCGAWRRALADGRYDYVVTAVNFMGANAEDIHRVRRWTRALPGTKTAFRNRAVVIYRITKTSSDDACP
jgi:hypothetical protein